MKIDKKVQPIFKIVILRGFFAFIIFMSWGVSFNLWAQTPLEELSPIEEAQEQVFSPESPAVLKEDSTSENTKAVKPKPKKKPARKKNVLIKDIYLEENKKISKEIDKAAENVDLFLAGKKVTDKPNDSTIRIENSFYHREGGEIQSGTHFGVNIRLPNLEKKWQLRFTSYDEKEEDRRIDQRQFRTQSKEENYGASFVFLRQLGKVRTSFQPRLELKDPLDVSYNLTFESDVEMTGYHVDPKLEFFARPQKGVGVFAAIPFTFLLSPIWSMTLQQEVEYQDRDNMFNHNSGISFSQRISDWAGIGYSWAAAADNRTTYHLVQHGFAVSWQHMLYEDALSYSVAPTWDFIKTRHFKGVAGLKLNLDFIF